MPIVKMPDGTHVRFPDDMPREQIRDMIASKFPDAVPQQAPDQTDTRDSDQSGYGRQIFSGLVEGATGALGAPVDLMNNLVVKPAVSGVNALLGTDIKASEAPLGGSTGLRQGMAIFPEGDSGGQQFARRVSQSIGGAAVPAVGSAQSIKQMLTMLITGAGGGVGGAAAQQVIPNNAGAEIAGELLGGLGTSGFLAGVANRQARKAAEATVLTIDQLKERSGALYDKADARDLTFLPADTQKTAASIREMAVEQGIDQTLHPKAVAALERLEDYAAQPMTVKNVRTVQRIINGAMKDPTNPDQTRIAGMIKEKFDGLLSSKVPEIREANVLYSRAKKAETVAKALDKAQLRTDVSGIGGNIDNAMRQRIAGLLMSDKDARIFNSAESALMKKMAKGGVLHNNLRRVGGFSPTTGKLSSLLTGAGAVAAPHIAIPAAGVGLAAKTAADSMTHNNANLLDLYIRSGGNIPTGSSGDLKRKLIEAMLGSQAAAQSSGR